MATSLCFLFCLKSEVCSSNHSFPVSFPVAAHVKDASTQAEGAGDKDWPKQVIQLKSCPMPQAEVRITMIWYVLPACFLGRFLTVTIPIKNESILCLSIKGDQCDFCSWRFLRDLVSTGSSTTTHQSKTAWSWMRSTCLKTPMRRSWKTKQANDKPRSAATLSDPPSR